MAVTTYVNKFIFNLSGDIGDRPDYIKTTLYSNILSNNYKTYFGDKFLNSYLNGSNASLKSAYIWSKNNSFSGFSRVFNYNFFNIDPNILKPYITDYPAGHTLIVRNAFYTPEDYRVICRQYVNKNNPVNHGGNWQAVKYSNTSFGYNFIDINTADITFTTAIPYPDNVNLLVAYYYSYDPTVLSTETSNGSGTNLLSRESLPSIEGYEPPIVTNDLVNTFTLNTSNTITYSYSDNRPDIVENISSDSRTVTKTDFTETRYQHILSNNGLLGYNTVRTLTKNKYVISTKYSKSSRILTYTYTENLDNGVIVTITKTTVEDYIQTKYSYTKTYQTGSIDQTIDDYVYIYPENSGEPALDTVISNIDDSKDIYPVFPIRMYNTPITTHPNYQEIKEGYKRFTGDDFTYVVDLIHNHPDLNKIDYSYVLMGVPINTPDMGGKQYIYEYFKREIKKCRMTKNEWNNLFNTKETPQLANTTINLKENSVFSSTYNIFIRFVYGVETRFTGVYNTHPSYIQNFDNSVIKTGDVHINGGGTFNIIEKVILQTNTVDYIRAMDTIHIFKQHTPNEYSIISLYGIQYEDGIGTTNLVLRGHLEADRNPYTNDESPFIIPLRNSVLNQTSSKNVSIITPYSKYLVIATYDAIYTSSSGWLQKSLFKVFAFIGIIVISVFFSPAAFAGIAGLFGTNLAVGTALGLEGIAAIAAGAALNGLAAVIVTSLITEGLTEIAGDSAKILSIALSILVPVFTGGFNLDSLFDSITSVDGLLKILDATGSIYELKLEEDLKEKKDLLLKKQSLYQSQLDDINKKFNELDNNNGIVYGTETFTNLNSGIDMGDLVESVDAFFNRVTLTGSDISEMFQNFVYKYPELNLDLNIDL